MKFVYESVWFSIIFVSVGVGIGINASRHFNTSDRELLRGKHFVIGTIEYAPYISFKSDARGVLHDIDGYVFEITLYIAEKYGFTHEYIESPAFGAIVNGSWNGLIGLLQQGKIDLAATGLTVTYGRSKVVDFCIPYMDDPLSLLIPYPELESSDISGIARPFDYEVWISIIISCFVCAASLRLVSLAELLWLKKTIKMTFTKHFWTLFSIISNAGSIIPKSLPMRLILTVWCLVCVVLGNAYRSILTSYLMAPRFHALFDSIEDVAASPYPTFMVFKYTSFETTVLEAEAGTTLGKIGDSIRKYPKELSLTNTENVADLVAQYKRTFTQEESTLMAIMEQDLKDTGTCRLSIAKKAWAMTQAALALPKSSPATQIFNREIIWLRQVGLLDHWRRQFWPRLNRCSDDLARLQVNSQTRLSLYYLSSAFLLLGVGIVISFVVFVIELVVARVSLKKI